MKKKQLTILAHLPHYHNGEGFESFEPYVREIELWATLFDEIIIYTQIVKEPSQWSTKLLPDNCQIKNIPISTGNGYKRIIRLFQTPFVFFYILWILLISDFVHLRSPGYTTAIANFWNLLLNKKTIVKWATLFPVSLKMNLTSYLESKLLLLSRNNTRVLVYRDIDKNNFIIFFPALFSKNELDGIYSNNTLEKWQNSKRKFIVISRLHHDKNLHFLINAIHYYIINFNSNFHVEIIGGDGGLEKELKLLVKNLVIQSNITFKGAMGYSEVITFLQNTHFLIMPGNREGWGKVINESLATGTIPLVINEGNAPNVMKQMGYPGLIFEQRYDDFSRIITEALKMDNNMVSKILKIGKEANYRMTLESFRNKLDTIITEVNKNDIT